MTPEAIDLSKWKETIRQIGKDLQEGNITTSDLNQSYIQQTYKELSEGAAKGYGTQYEIVNEQGIPNGRVIDMKRNLYKFAAAKNTAMLTEINSLLYDGDRLKSFEEFKASLDALNIKYNHNWLKTEYRTAVQSGHSAKAWEAFQHNKERFPNLRYTTQGDNAVREEHEALNGFVAHIDDPIWSSIAPPSGWNCRCYLVQTAEPVSKETPDWEKEVAPEFRVNTGQSGQIYNEDSKTGHRFFALAKDTPGWEKRFELSKLEAGYERVKTPGGGKVKVSIYADENDLEDNLKACYAILDTIGHQLDIRPHLYLTDWKNPEYLDSNKTKGDRVSPEWNNVKTATNNAFKEKLSKKKNGQLSEEKNAFLVIEVNFEPTNNNISDFTKQSWSKFKHYKQLDYVILYKGNKAIKINRNVFNSEIDYYSKLIKKIL